MKKLLVICAFLFIGLGLARAGKKLELPVWSDSAVTAGSAYDPVMYCYLPDRPNGVAVVMCPGGGYGHLAIGHEGHDMADWFNAQGITYVVLKYRLPENCRNYPKQDAQQAILNVRERAAEWGIDPHKVGIMGGSAGGHLASSVATYPDDESMRPDFQVLLYPVITMVDMCIIQIETRNNLLGKNPDRETQIEHSPKYRVDAKTPQAFRVLSADDKGVIPTNSIRYFEALSQNKIPVEMHIYPTGDHGWGFRDSFIYKPQWTAELSNWFRRSVLGE